MVPSIGASTVTMPYGGKYQLTPVQTMIAKLPVLRGKCDTVTMMSYGFDPYLSSWSPYHGAAYAVISSVAKIVAAGGDYTKIRFTFQEYFRRLGNDPKRWGEPLAALLGAYEAQMRLGLPSIGGKDSMSGTFQDIDVPPTLVSFAVDVAKVGDIIEFGDGKLSATVEDIVDGGCRVVRFVPDKQYSSLFDALDDLGTMPLPPYITEKLEDQNRYQTVYSKTQGSAAAPTAGLHFTEELLEEIEKKGCKIARVLLHVGLGTFRPVKEDKIADHIMHSEFICVSDETAELINSRRAAGGRTIAVGTTSCRVIESVSSEDGRVNPYSGDTGIFIYPGYKFKATDALITNFHLPESTLLMLVSAFSSRERMLASYEEAVREKYRFFSFGDAMIIL